MKTYDATTLTVLGSLAVIPDPVFQASDRAILLVFSRHKYEYVRLCRDQCEQPIPVWLCEQSVLFKRYDDVECGIKHGWDQMLEDSSNKLYDYVIVYDRRDTQSIDQITIVENDQHIISQLIELRLKYSL